MARGVPGREGGGGKLGNCQGPQEWHKGPQKMAGYMSAQQKQHVTATAHLAPPLTHLLATFGKYYFPRTGGGVLRLDVQRSETTGDKRFSFIKFVCD